MTSDVDEWILQATELIETAVEESIEEVAKEAAQLVREYTFPNRRKTRESVRYRITGPNSAEVGLYFGQKFTGNTNTFTHRHFREVWRDVRPQIEARLINRLNQKLQGE